VIVSWSMSGFTEKAHRAASILKNRLATPSKTGGGGGGGGMGVIEADLSSYGHVLKACATVDVDNEKSRRLGAEIAVMVWKELEGSGLLLLENDVDGDAGGKQGDYSNGASGRRRGRRQRQAASGNNGRSGYHNESSSSSSSRKKERRPNVFVFAIRSMQFVERETMRNSMIRRQFKLCKELGLVNNHVLLAFESVASLALVDEQFRGVLVEEEKEEENSKVVEKKKKKNIRVVRSFWQIPSEWKRNVASTDSSSGW